MARKNRRHGLLPLRNALHEAGDPQNALRIIHVTGTNGKGSTVNFLRAILQAHGFCTGTFTSPHLTDHRDRIRINDSWIEKEVFDSYLHEHMELIEKYDLGMFEIDFLIACLWFRDQKTDYAIMEAGLGGRSDSTNVVEHSLLSIITTIGFDHMALLGERISQIAFEKAGIIKENGRCLCGYIDEKLKRVIAMHAYRKHAACSFVPKYRSSGKTMTFMDREYTVGSGEYQKKNAALALRAAWMLGVDIRDGKTADAISNAQWKGRFETVCENPRIIIDGAHNEEGIRALCSCFSEFEKPLVIVFSALADKPQKKMISLLQKHASMLIVTHFENERSGDFESLKTDGALFDPDWKSALKTACEHVGSGTIVVTGSLYFVSETREYLMQKTS